MLTWSDPFRLHLSFSLSPSSSSLLSSKAVHVYQMVSPSPISPTELPSTTEYQISSPPTPLWTYPTSVGGCEDVGLRPCRCDWKVTRLSFVRRKNLYSEWMNEWLTDCLGPQELWAAPSRFAPHPTTSATWPGEIYWRRRRPCRKLGTTVPQHSSGNWPTNQRINSTKLNNLRRFLQFFSKPPLENCLSMR